MPNQRTHTASTLFLLMAQYNGQTVVPIDQVCRDFFGHLTVEKLLRKCLRGDLALPIVRIESSQKAQQGVHLVDLAARQTSRGCVEGMPPACRYDVSTTSVRYIKFVSENGSTNHR